MSKSKGSNWRIGAFVAASMAAQVACGADPRDANAPVAPAPLPGAVATVTPGGGDAEGQNVPSPAPTAAPTTEPSPDRRDPGSADFTHAPLPFETDGVHAVPMDIESIDLAWEFRVDARQALGTAVIRFRVAEEGAPFFDLVPDPSLVKLNGTDLDPAVLPTVRDPDGVTYVRVLKEKVAPGTVHTLQISYALRSSEVSFVGDAVRFGSFMDDLEAGGRQFWELYAPSNLEFDQFAQSLDLKITGTNRAHELFANGSSIEQPTQNHWKVLFPNTHTTSSVFVQFAEVGRFSVQRFEVQGKEKKVPFTIYSSSAGATASAASKARAVFAELENTYGAYMHPCVIAYITPTGGGMEHAGATVSDYSALDHEMTHFYFARGVMPARGSAGWIDESVASWRDNGYPRGPASPNRASVNLASFAPFRRQTPMASYTEGARLMSEFDGMFAAKGGLRPVLRSLYGERHGKVIDTPFFQAFLEKALGRSLEGVFSRYVYGRQTVGAQRRETVSQGSSGHPRPFPRSEWEKLR